MKTRVVKFDSAYLYLGFSVNRDEARLSEWESNHHKLTDGPIVLSLKCGKRRRLVKGKILITQNYNNGHNCRPSDEYYFIPNNVQKLRAIMHANDLAFRKRNGFVD